MNCKIFQTEIKESDWGAPLGLAAREHLDDCAACRKTHDEQTTLRLMISELEKVAAPADFDVRLRSRIAATERSEQRIFRGRLTFSPGTVSVALAAAFVLVSAFVVRFSLIEKAMTIDPPSPAVETVTQKPGAVSIPEVERPTASDIELIAAKEVVSKPTASAQNSTSHRRRIVATRAGDARTDSGPPLAETASGTRTMGLMGASVFSAGASAAVAVPVRGDVEPVSLILKNERGESQKVSLKPVSFGAQQFVGRFNSTVHNSSTNREGVW